MMLRDIIHQYINIQKQLNLAILLPQYILNYQQNRTFDIISHIKKYLDNPIAYQALEQLVIEKVFLSESAFIVHLQQWIDSYFDKTQLSLQQQKLMPQLEHVNIQPDASLMTLQHDLFLLQLAQLEYDKSQLSTQVQCKLVQGLYQYYTNSKTMPNLQVVSGDDMTTGLEMSCYIFNQTHIIFAFRGSQTKFFQTMSPQDFQQSRLDWQYNLKAIVQGTTTSQYDQAIKFIGSIYQQYPNIKQCLATGHSLGGHLVQLIQISHRYFDDYVIANSSPVQLKQLFLLNPNRFSSLQWQQLFSQSDKQQLLHQWCPNNIGRIYQYESDLINIASEIQQTCYYGKLIMLPGQAYYHYQPYLYQCFTQQQLIQLTTIVYQAMTVKEKANYDFIFDILQTMIFSLLSQDNYHADYIQLVVNLLKYFRLNNWLVAEHYDKCLMLLQQYQQSFDINSQLNYLYRTKLIVQFQYQLYKGLNITLLMAIASMHRLSGHWFTLEERILNDNHY